MHAKNAQVHSTPQGALALDHQLNHMTESLKGGRRLTVHDVVGLVHVGTLYREATKDYYLSAPDGRHRYPDRLEDLLKDARHLVTKRYLRQFYPDPMTGLALVPLTAPQGGIWGGPVLGRSRRYAARLRRA